MEEPSYNRQLLTDYLLNALPSDETERLDALKVTDEAFVQELTVVENDLVDAYVNRELKSKSLRQFEAVYLASPLRREKVALARALQDYGQQHRFAPQVRPQEQTITARRGSLFFPRFVGQRTWQWTFAAALLILVGLSGWLIFKNLQLRSTPDRDQISQIDIGANKQTQPKQNMNTLPPQPQPTASNESKKLPSTKATGVASIVLVPQMRGATDVPVVTIKHDTANVAVRLELEPSDYSVYRIWLLRQPNGKVLLRMNNVNALTSDGDKTLNVRLPVALLQPDSYVLRVFGISQTGASELISDYRFRVVK